MKKELNEQFIIDLSKKKNEPEWMLEFRLKSYEKFKELDNPEFGPKLEFDFDNINYYKGNEEKLTNDWEKVNCSIRNRSLLSPIPHPQGMSQVFLHPLHLRRMR